MASDDQQNNGFANNSQSNNGQPNTVQETVDNITPPPYSPGPVGAAPVQPAPSYVHVIRELARINLDLTNLYLESVTTRETEERQMHDQQNNLRTMMLESINRNHCIRRRNATFYSINPDTADLQPLVSVLMGVTIENFPETMEDLNRLTGNIASNLSTCLIEKTLT